MKVIPVTDLEGMAITLGLKLLATQMMNPEQFVEYPLTHEQVTRLIEKIDEAK